MTSALATELLAHDLPAGDDRAGKARRAPAVVIRPAPRREPPFDDERAEWWRYQAGPLDQRLPFGADPRARPTTTDAASELPDPAAWGRRLITGIIEIANGRRPLHQLSALLSAGVAAGLRTDLETAVRNGGRHWTHAARIRSMHASQPLPGIAELNATVGAGRRVRAIALRMEAQQGCWRCTRLQLG